MTLKSWIGFLVGQLREGGRRSQTGSRPNIKGSMSLSDKGKQLFIQSASQEGRPLRKEKSPPFGAAHKKEKL